MVCNGCSSSSGGPITDVVSAAVVLNDTTSKEEIEGIQFTASKGSPGKCRSPFSVSGVSNEDGESNRKSLLLGEKYV